MSPRGVASAPRMPMEERRRQLLDITLRLVVEEGFGAVQAQRIASEAGITKPIVYRAYPSLAALQIAMLRREQRRVDGVLAKVVPADAGDLSPRDLLLQSLGGVLDAAAKRPLTWRLALHPPEGTPAIVRKIIDRRRQALLDRTRGLVQWGLPKLGGGQAIDDELMARVLLALAIEHVQIVLDDPQTDRDALLRSTEAILDRLRWT
ncbi:MAG: TetR/AcrR family transcriptional regulator [Solirubrobacteraceae bacterium]|nr:TetR/AcrR family transcriptional regulator [Solirubrobacteraceae bacterium]